MSVPSFDEIYEGVTTQFREGKFVQAACQINALILRAMKEMYGEAMEEMSDDESKALRAVEFLVLRGKGIESANLKNITRLFERAKFLLSVKGTASEGRLLRAYDLAQVAALSIECCDSSMTIESDDLRLRVKWLLDFTTLLLKFKGWIRDDIIKLQQARAEGVILKSFLLNLKTGILKNVEDLARNVSFKAVTFVTILSLICDRLLIKSGPVGKTQMAELLDQYLFMAGNRAGSNFGRALLEKLDEIDLGMPFKERIDRWCDFDTHVGWGRFRNEVVVDKATGRVSGRIVLENNFLVTGRGRADFNLCSLMTGYVSGVLGKLLKMPIEVRHDKKYDDCAQFSLNKSSCEFIVSNTEE